MRQEKILLKKGGKDTELSWDKARLILTEKIKGLLLRKKRSRVAVILNTWLTNEELFLAHKIFRQSLNLERVFTVDPPAGRGDGFLLTEERTPNSRGAREIGLPAASFDLETLTAATDLLLIFGSFLAERQSLAEIQRAFDRVGTKVLFTPHRSGLDALVDVIIPTLLVAEKNGSLTNADGKVQSFAPALDGGRGLPEWKILLDLAKESGVDYKYFWKLDSPKAILREMGQEIPFFK